MLKAFSNLDIEPLTISNVYGGYSNGVFDFFNASAIVGRSADSIFISFTGTNELLDKWDWLQREVHYSLFSSMISEIDHYASIPANGIKHIYVTGHSLGAAMAQAYMPEHASSANIDYEAIAFANPGYGPGLGLGKNIPDSRMNNILIIHDIIHIPGDASPIRGDIYRIPTKLSFLDAQLTSTSLHEADTYKDVGHALGQIYGIFPNPSLSEYIDPAPNVIDVNFPGFYVDDTGETPNVNLPIHSDVGWGILTDTSGINTGIFSIANSTPVTVNMETGHIYSNQPVSIGDGATKILAADFALGVSIGNFLIDSAVATTNKLIVIGTNLKNFISGGEDDAIYAGGGDDVIDIGIGSGPDYYDGGDGNDTLIYASTLLGITVNLSLAMNQAFGSEIDTDQIFDIENITGGSGSDTLIGNNAANILQGLDGSDTLNGRGGADTMIGGDGSDIYYVDNTGDVVGDIVKELPGQGTDLIKSAISYSLVDTDGAGTNGGNVENLQLIGNAAINATGNALNNTLYANTANNVLKGGAGNDTASYAAGASAGVKVSLASTTAQVTGGSGSDTLLKIENLTGSTYNDNLTGNAAANRLDGKAGNDKLAGGEGNDTLTGGQGKDTFWFDSAPSATTNKDSILDFVSGTDKLQFSKSVLTKLGIVGQFAAGDDRFWSNTTGQAFDAEDRLIYNTVSGELFYDSNGNATGGAVLVEVLATAPVLAATDIWVV